METVQGFAGAQQWFSETAVSSTPLFAGAGRGRFTPESRQARPALPHWAGPSQREVPLRPSPPLLLAKPLQHLEVKPDALAPPVLGLA
jgi:hypothetical protein